MKTFDNTTDFPYFSYFIWLLQNNCSLIKSTFGVCENSLIQLGWILGYKYKMIDWSIVGQN